MKLKVARAYQAVEFERTLQTYFAEDRRQKEPLDIRILEGLAAISIRSSEDHIIIPLTNIAYMKVSDDEILESKKSKK